MDVKVTPIEAEENQDYLITNVIIQTRSSLDFLVGTLDITTTDDNRWGPTGEPHRRGEERKGWHLSHHSNGGRPVLPHWDIIRHSRREQLLPFLHDTLKEKILR
ncbi:hypothetical protein Syun_001018 [Stephania yunnanensis]|uniref:Uncharacterized protein n=1 Tax=Stephania yunnanensis TaxID=152371 RepID=A0AAP0Q6P7_9MAGN